MKRFSHLLFFALMIAAGASILTSCSKSAASNKPQDEQFWEWFASQSDTYFEFEKDQATLFQELDAELKKVDPNLTFEFGPANGAKRELVISAGGIQKSFPTVENLIAKAPKLEKWTFIAFRQRKAADYTALSLDGLKLDKNQAFFRSQNADGKLNVDLYLQGYQDIDKWHSFGFALLDQAIGEHDVETYLGGIGFYDLAGQDTLTMMPLRKLPAIVDQAKTAH